MKQLLKDLRERIASGITHDTIAEFKGRQLLVIVTQIEEKLTAMEKQKRVK